MGLKWTMKYPKAVHSGEMPDAAWFWGRVDRTGECWVWTGAKSRGGYGQLRIHNKLKQSHRIAYQIHYGADPGEHFVCHTCDNRLCCRPEHLFLGLSVDNVQDAVNKGRMGKGVQVVALKGCPRRSGERNGNSKLTPLKVLEIRSRYGSGGVTQRELAAIYGVSPSMIGQIARGLFWQQVK